MPWPTKILPFLSPAGDLARPALIALPDAFPRFHKEASRPATPLRPIVRGFAVPPNIGR